MSLRYRKARHQSAANTRTLLYCTYHGFSKKHDIRHYSPFIQGTSQEYRSIVSRGIIENADENVT